MLRNARRSVSLLTLCVFVATQSWAGALPTVAVPPLGESPDQRASDAIAQAFRAAGKVNVVDRNAVERHLKGRKGSAAAKGEPNREASEALKRGEEAFAKLDVAEAIRHWTKAKLAYRKQLSDDDSFQGMRAAQFRLAMAYLTKRDEARAAEELREFVRLDPERNTRRLSEKQHPPAVRNLHEKVRKETARKPGADLEIVTTPSKAIVYIDGKSEGTSPVTVKSLPVGEHFVRVSGEGLETFFASKFLVAGENRVDVELKPALTVDPYKMFGTVAASPDLDHRRAAFLDEVGLALGADIWAFLTPGNAEVFGQLYDQRSQELSAVAKDSSPEGLVKKLLRSVGSDGYVFRPVEKEEKPAAAAEAGAPLPKELRPAEEGTFSREAGKPSEAAPVVPRGRPWYRNPWIWAGIGAGVVAGGAAGVCLFSSVCQSGASRSTIKVVIP